MDFYCSKLLLWIEIDGWYHNEQTDYDEMRDEMIKKYWIQVVRFTNEDIEKNLEWVMIRLEEVIQKRESYLINNSTIWKKKQPKN